MKVLVVLCAVAACCVAKPGGYLAPGGYSTSVVSYSSSIVHPSPAVYAAPAPAVVAAPAPAPVVYSAPAVVAAPAPAPIVYSAPAPAPVAVAPAPVVYSAPAPAPAVVAAPAPAVLPAPAPAPVVYSAPAPAPVAVAPEPVVPAPVVVAAPVAAAVKTQYHSQDEHGQAAYGHSEPGQVHNAVQDVHGNKAGSFSYVAPNGHVLRTDYVADGAGYRVASNALPVAQVGLGHRVRRSLVQTPASTQPLPVAYAAPAVYAVPAPAPAVYTVPAPAPVVVRAPAPITYTAPAVVPAAPIVPAPAPVAYAAPVPAAPVAYAPAPAVALAAPAVRHATLTTVVNNPGHAVSYRVD